MARAISDTGREKLKTTETGSSCYGLAVCSDECGMIERMAEAILRKEKISSAGVSDGMGGKFVRKTSYIFVGEIVTRFSAFDDRVMIGYDMVHFEVTDDGRYAEVDRFGQPFENGGSEIKRLRSQYF